MNPKYLATGLIALFVIVGWNAFLIQRDDALYRAYYKNQAIQQAK
jgi:hypothetical protein